MSARSRKKPEELPPELVGVHKSATGKTYLSSNDPSSLTPEMPVVPLHLFRRQVVCVAGVEKDLFYCRDCGQIRTPQEVPAAIRKDLIEHGHCPALTGHYVLQEQTEGSMGLINQVRNDRDVQEGRAIEAERKYQTAERSLTQLYAERKLLSSTLSSLRAEHAALETRYAELHAAIALPAAQRSRRSFAGSTP